MKSALPGIYRPSVAGPTARLSLLGPLWLAVWAGCGSRAPEATAVLLPVSPATGAAKAAAPPGFVGVVIAGEWVDVESRVEGRLQAVFVKPGDRVRRGAPLARLDTYASRHDLAAARAALREASRRFNRRKRLARSSPDAVTVEELDVGRRDLTQTRARVAQLTEAEAEAVIRAPVDGIVVQRFAAVGVLASPARPIVRIAGSGDLRIRFAIPQERASAIALGDRVRVSIQDEEGTRPGRVTDLSPEIDVSTRLIYAAAVLDSVPRPVLATGMIARVFPKQDPGGRP